MDRHLVQGALPQNMNSLSPSHDPVVMVPTTLPISPPVPNPASSPGGYTSLHSSLGPWSPSNRIPAALSSPDSFLCSDWQDQVPKSLPGLRRPYTLPVSPDPSPLLHSAGHIGLPTAPGRISMLPLAHSHSVPGKLPPSLPLAPPCLVPAPPTDLS